MKGVRGRVGAEKHLMSKLRRPLGVDERAHLALGRASVRCGLMPQVRLPSDVLLGSPSTHTAEVVRKLRFGESCKNAFPCGSALNAFSRNAVSAS